MDQILRNQFFRIIGFRDPLPQIFRVDERLIPWLEKSCPLWIVGTGPPVLIVPGIPEGIVPFLPSRWGGVVTFARDEIDSGHENVQRHPVPGLMVEDGRPGQPVCIQSHGPAEIVQTMVDFLRGGGILRRKIDDRRRVPISGCQAIRDQRHLVRVTA